MLVGGIEETGFITDGVFELLKLVQFPDAMQLGGSVYHSPHSLEQEMISRKDARRRENVGYDACSD
jgi:hypothetical protein